MILRMGSASGKNEAYRHRRLTTPRSIRVLTLNPSPIFTTPLEARLTEISLDSISSLTLPYEALSYVWGSPTGDRPLRCDNKLLLVTSNCESALRHLREAERARTLWVDAICIDQGDGDESVRERNGQVALMGEVYHRAARTLCWLGEGTKFTGEVITRLGQIGSCQSKRGLKKLLQLDERLRRSGSLDVDSTSLEHIFCHPWHSRIWTVQEVAHSRDCQMMCGHATLSWDLYTAAAKFLIYEEFIDELDIQASKTYVGIDVRNTLRNYILSAESHSLADDEENKENRIDFLTSCLSQVRHLQATNPKDKIYGLYAAFSALGVPLPAPDYEKPLIQVYEEATVSMIVYSRSLHVLCYASSNDRSQNLPSWVPDWQDENVKLVTPPSQATEGSKVANTDFSMLVKMPGQIRVRGKIVGVVTTRAQSDFATLDIPSDPLLGGLPILTDEKYNFINEIGNLRLLIHTIKLFREWKRLVETVPSQFDEEEFGDVFYDILNFSSESSPRDLFDIWVDILDYPDTKHDLSIGEQMAEKWKAADSSNATQWSTELSHCAIIAASLISHSPSKGGTVIPQATALPDVIADLSGNMGDRALILIHDYGLSATVLGTAFHTVKTDDVLVLLEGSDCPVVLRKKQEELWRFVGPAFVMGLMDGEGWSDEEGVVDELKDFVLV